jgi:hypothetical protein
MSRTCQKDDSAIFEGEPLRCRHERATVRLPDGTTLDGRPKSLPMSSIVPTDRNRVSYSLSTPSVPTVDAWAVRDARTDISADVIIWSHSVSAPGPEAVFIPVLKTPLVTSAQFPSACSSPPAPQSERGTRVCGSASCNFFPVVGGVVLPNFTYRTDSAATSAAACGTDCAADPMCRAYSWCGLPRPGLTSCALKSAVSTPVGTSLSCASGIVRP